MGVFRLFSPFQPCSMCEALSLSSPRLNRQSLSFLSHTKFSLLSSPFVSPRLVVYRSSLSHVNFGALSSPDSPSLSLLSPLIFDLGDLSIFPRQVRAVDQFALLSLYVFAPILFISRRFKNLDQTLIASEGLKHRVFETSLANLQGDEEHTYRNMRFRAEDVQGRNVLTNFWGMNFTTDKLRSLVRKWLNPKSNN